MSVHGRLSRSEPALLELSKQNYILYMPAVHAHHAGIMERPTKQYTIRNVPERMDMRLREAAVEYGTSLNATALRALAEGLGVAATPVIHHDLDDLIGTWVADSECDRVLGEMDRVDSELWT